MATKTLGTNATTTLTGFQLPASYVGQSLISDADWATVMSSIFDDSRNPQQKLNQQIMNAALVRSGNLVVPNRGVLRILPGDWVGVDPNGWPILIGYQSMAATLTVTGTPTSGSAALASLSANVLQQGWWPGMALSGTNIASGAVISAIASDGKSLTMSKNATGSPGATTITAGSWTHS